MKRWDLSKVFLGEPKAQRWRIVALQKHNVETLVYLGSNITQLREKFIDSWSNYIPKEVRNDTRKLIIQKWNGVPDDGWWSCHGEMPIPDENQIPSLLQKEKPLFANLLSRKKSRSK